MRLTMPISRHAIDALLKHGFEPKRTFVWAYGFDEEAAGTEVDDFLCWHSFLITPSHRLPPREPETLHNISRRSTGPTGLSCSSTKAVSSRNTLSFCRVLNVRRHRRLIWRSVR